MSCCDAKDQDGKRWCALHALVKEHGMRAEENKRFTIWILGQGVDKEGRHHHIHFNHEDLEALNSKVHHPTIQTS
jgi:hypothetical protein